MMTETGYLDDEGRWCVIERASDSTMPRLSAHMRDVLRLFLQSDAPFALYAQVTPNVENGSDDAQFLVEVTMLQQWLKESTQ